MRTDRSLSWLLSVCALCGAAVVLAACGSGKQACNSGGFDRSTWVAANAANRRTIAVCGVKSHAFIGWSRARACHELGRPYDERKRVWRWSLGPDDVGFHVIALELKFEPSNHAASAAVVDAGEPETPGPLSARGRAACAKPPSPDAKRGRGSV